MATDTTALIAADLDTLRAIRDLAAHCLEAPAPSLDDLEEAIEEIHELACSDEEDG